MDCTCLMRQLNKPTSLLQKLLVHLIVLNCGSNEPTCHTQLQLTHNMRCANFFQKISHTDCLCATLVG